jgi:hypothetical protein
MAKMLAIWLAKACLISGGYAEIWLASAGWLAASEKQLMS